MLGHKPIFSCSIKTRLQDLLLDPVDLALSDLPIGYYPNDERAKGFAAAAEKAIVMRIIY